MVEGGRPEAQDGGVAAVFEAFKESCGGSMSAADLASVLKDVAKITDGEVEQLLAAAGVGAGGPEQEGAVAIEDFLAWVFGDVAEQRPGPEVIFVLGGPGCGKGTFSSRIVEQFGYRHLSAGDLLRAERKRAGSSTAELIESYIREGKIVPSDITVGLLEQEMRRQCWEGGRYLIDGFPRSLDNLEGWQRLLGRKTRLAFCLLIECSQECMERRLLKRGETSGRSDDNIETIRKRFVTFKQESLPVLQRLEGQGLVRKVDSEPGIDAVWHEVEAIFGEQS